jgi:hypothetical protein
MTDIEQHPPMVSDSMQALLRIRGEFRCVCPEQPVLTNDRVFHTKTENGNKSVD